MKTEERHKLHRNELADRLGEWNQRIKPYSNAIFIALLALAVGMVALAVWTQRSRTEAANAWDRYYQAINVASMGDPNALGELDKLALGTQAPKVAHCAALSAADMYLARGCQELFEDKTAAGEDLRKAVEHYRLVQAESREPMLLEQACYGLARAYEALAGTEESQGTLPKAVEAYQQLVDKWPNGPYAERAAARLEDLNRLKTKKFYDDFAEFDPRPAAPLGAPGLPRDLPGSGIPFDEGALSEDSPIFGPGGSVRPDWTEDAETPPGEKDASEPGQAEADESEGPAMTPPTDQAGPDLKPAEGAEPSPPPSAEEAPEPKDTPEPEMPEAPSTPEPAPATEGPQQPPAAAEEAPEAGPSPAEEPSEASP